MNVDHLERVFAKIGARVKVTETASPRHSSQRPRPFVIDIARDRRGEFFEFRHLPQVDPEVIPLNVQPAERQLLLMVKGASDGGLRQGERDIQKFLCGHDERSWFVAAVPAVTGASTVRGAKEALMPAEVRASLNRMRVKSRHRHRRRNAGLVRQGEWFFVPSPGFTPGDGAILTDEPLLRGRGKPHVAQFVCRSGGVTVYVTYGFPRGLTQEEHERLIRRHPKAAKRPWQVRVQDPKVFARGTVKHPNHKTIVLRCWHLAVPNTENLANARRNLAFLD